MPRGRPAKGPKLVEGLDGSESAKKRLEVILETVAGKRTVEDACKILGIRRSAFHKIRNQILQTALTDLEPKPRGRPRQEISEEAGRVAELETQVKELTLRLKVAHVREEIMLAMPEVFEPLKEAKKKARAKNKPAKKQRKKRRRKR
jgi:hypothetical protein